MSKFQVLVGVAQSGSVVGGSVNPGDSTLVRMIPFSWMSGVTAVGGVVALVGTSVVDVI